MPRLSSSISRVATGMVVGVLAVACTSAPSPTSSPTAPSPPAGRPAITAISAGGAQTCVLTSGGGVKCWGNHGFGGTPGGAIAQSIVPVDIAGLASGVVSIDAGGAHTCALTSGGGVKCWGYNDIGQLGDGTTTEQSTPVDVAGLVNGVTAVSAGRAHTCVVTIGGGVKCWGYNYIGQLGDGTTTERSTPVDVTELASGASAIAVSDEHTCALTSGGAVSCWGYNGAGQLGNGTAIDSLVPVAIPALPGDVRAISAGLGHSCALTAGGGVKCWGRNGSGQLGDGTTTDRKIPVDVQGLASGVIAIAAGGSHTCALTSGGQVKCWGANSAGQLGNGATIDSTVAVDVAALGSGITAIAAGGSHACALAGTGAVGCWGDNMYWQLGSRSLCEPSSSVPVAVAFVVPSFNGGSIDHAKGPTDVVLRFDIGPDLILPDQFSSDVFRPGPEFTLYGDGTAIFRNERADLLPAEGPIIRARPFGIVQLDEDHIQSLLMFALGEGGLVDACERYEAPATGDSTSSVFTIRAGGVDRRVEIVGSANPLEVLADRLRDFDEGGGIPTMSMAPTSYRGSLIEVGPREAGVLPWPFTDITPADFVVPAGSNSGIPSRVMSPREAGVHGFTDISGIVKRVYLLGPDGKTIYHFSLWPMLPDETS